MLVLVILSILVTWLLCAAVAIGIGSQFLRGFHPPFSLLDALWTGVALIAAILQLYHFFRPIDLFAVYLLLGLALVGWLSNFSRLIRLSTFPFPLSYFLLLSTAAAIIAFRAAGPCEHYDTGLYGASAIRWIATYRVVPGLANLLGQLGFNSSVFLCIAALDQGPWRHLAHHLFSGFLIAALFASILSAALRVFFAQRISPMPGTLVAAGKSSSPVMAISASDWFLTLLFLPAAIWAATGKIVGANTDLPTSVICLVAASMLFRALDDSSSGHAGGAAPEQPRDDTRRVYLGMAMLLFSLAITFKISSLIFAFSGWTLACVKLWSLNRDAKQRKWLWACSCVLSSLLVVPWMARGVISTGYPLYPSTALPVAVDWRVPAVEAQRQAEVARSFARIPKIPIEKTRGWEWLRPWFRELVREREGFLIPVFFALLGGVAGIIRMRGEKQTQLPRWLWLLGPSLAGLLFWFFEAPAIRFGEPALWTAGATLGTFAALHFLDSPLKIRIALLGLLLMTAWAAHPRLLWGSYFHPSLTVRTFLLLPEAKLELREISPGLRIYMPVETNQCWDAPLPCSPYFSETLRLRQTGELRRGFESAGLQKEMRVPSGADQ